MFNKLIVLIIGVLLASSNVYAFDTFENAYPQISDVEIVQLPVYSKYLPKKSEIIFNESSRVVDAINPTARSNKVASHLPGARGANQLIVYTSEYNPRTGTNEFGAEAIVVGNTVVEMSGADSYIPVNGIVISGHGVAKTWINQNLKVGTKVYLDSNTKTIYATTTSESYLFEAGKKIDEAKSMVEYYKASNADYDFRVPNYYIKEANEYLKKAGKEPQNIKKYSQLAIESANTALKSVVPYKNNEFKGVWVRPVETNADDIEKSVKRIKAAGIDNIFIETFYHGRTIFPSETMAKYGFVMQNEKFAGFDPLKVWVKYARKHDIKVHIWFETFYVGIQRPETNPGNILAIKPEWGNKTKKNYNLVAPTPSASEHNGFFIDPANTEVQTFLLELMEEILDNYKVEGINLDYIRYPQSVAVNDMNSWGYTEFARNEFKSIYGKDPAVILMSDPLWVKWCEYRREKITNFVAKAGALTREKGIYLSAVIFPDRLSALTTKQQDWKTWSTRGYVNGFTPLFLTCNAKTLNALVTNVIKAKAPGTDLFAGLFVTFMGGSEEDLIREIHETRKINVNGVILFDYAHLDNKYVSALSTRVFNERNDKRANIPSETVRLKRIDGSTQHVNQKQVKVTPKQKEEKKKRFWRR